MSVDVGDELQHPARAVAATGVRRQSHAPVASAYPDVDDGLPFVLRVGVLHEVAHALMLPRNGFDRLRRPQHGVPGGAIFCQVDVLPCEERFAGVVEATGVQQGGGCQAGCGRIDLRAEIDGESGRLHKA
ncbi:hypothetical protein D3C87_1721610 [compost metagenome]